MNLTVSQMNGVHKYTERMERAHPSSFGDCVFELEL